MALFNNLQNGNGAPTRPELNKMPSTMKENGAPTTRGVYLLTCPRSASNMFQTMLSKQPNHRNSGYWFFQSAMGTLMNLPKGQWAKLPEEEREQYLALYQSGYDNLLEELQKAKDEDKKALVKEHAVLMYGPEYLFQKAHGKDGSPKFTVKSKDNQKPQPTNPTCVPDDLLLSMQPIFQIRHPALMFPSMARAERDTGAASGPMDPRVHVFCGLQFSRDLYQWYLDQPNAPTPLIISADDIMNKPEVVRKLCVDSGLDPDALQYEWETREAPPGAEQIKRFASTIYASKGILPGYTSDNIDMEKKKAGWREEFGEEAGDFLAEKVQGAMPDYEWLMERRVQV